MNPTFRKYFTMNTNPWLVESTETFLYLNCPECVFLTKEKATFKNHAQEKHTLSSVFFGKNLKRDNIEFLNSASFEDELNSTITKPLEDFDLPRYDSDFDDQNINEDMMLEGFESDIDQREGNGLK